MYDDLQTIEEILFGRANDCELDESTIIDNGHNGDYTNLDLSFDSYNYADCSDLAFFEDFLAIQASLDQSITHPSADTAQVAHDTHANNDTDSSYKSLHQNLETAVDTNIPISPTQIHTDEHPALAKLQSLSSTDFFFQRSFLPELPVGKEKGSENRQAAARKDNGRPTLTSTKRSRSQQEDNAVRFPECELWEASEDAVEETSTSDSTSQGYSPSPSSGDLGLGIQSATALFKRPSAVSKRYTRPVMSRLYASLEITPETFVHLQAAAKKFMLDNNHPERFSCVSDHTDKKQVDIKRLRLFTYAEEFLSVEGWGERCYGADAVGADRRKLKWPQLKEQIITLIIPLLRRMVANEKQRQYAATTRSERAKKRVKRSDEANSASNSPYSASPQPPLLQPSSKGHINPLVNAPHHTLEGEGRATPASQTDSKPNIFDQFGRSDTTDLTYQISLMQNGRRIRPKFAFAPASRPSFVTFMESISGLLDGDHILASVHVLRPNGLVECLSEDSWVESIESIRDTEWMDREVKVVCETKTFMETF